MNNQIIASGIAILAVLCGCGREPSRLLRQGQLPIYDFPLYVSEGAVGRVWKIEKDRTKTLLLDGLNDPRGVATDRFQNLYIAEYGAGRVLKLKAGENYPLVILEGLQAPSFIALDGIGEGFVTQDYSQSVVRLSDGKEISTFSSSPSAIGFGVNDLPIVAFFNEGSLSWGWNGSAVALVQNPTSVSVDGTGRVYVAEGDFTNGKLHRYHQRSGDGHKVLAENLAGPMGIAVDLVGNVFVIEQGAGRIVLLSPDGSRYSWIGGLDDPQYLAFTQY